MINCKKCGAVIPDNLDSCLICGAKSGELPPQAFEAEYIAAPAAALTAKAAVKRHPKAMTHVMSVTGIFLALAAAVVFAMQVLPYYFGSPGMSRAKNAIIYTTGDGYLKFMSPSAEEPEIIDQVFGQRGITDAKASSNGKYIAYLRRTGSTGDLYLRDFSARPTVTQNEARDILAASNVESFLFTESGSHIIYLTGDGGLYSYDFTQSRLLDENIREILDCNDGKILYIGKSDTPVSTLYVGEYLSGANSKSVVADDVSELVDYTPAFDKFIFTVRQDADGVTQAINDIVTVDLKQGTRQTLATGAEKIIAADAKSFTALYQTSYANPIHYDNIINDDFAREDDKIDEPNLDDYPLLKEFYEKYGTDADYEGSMEFEDIAEESAKLDMAIAAYDQMRAHEKLREKILYEIDDFVEQYPTLYDLYLCRDGNVARISESSYSPFDDAKLDVSSGVVSWRETNFTVLEKTLLSRYPSDANVFALLSDKLTDKLYVQPFGQSAVQIKIDGKDNSFICGGWQLTSKADGVYFAMSEGTPPVSERNSSSVKDYFPLDCTLYYYYAGTNTEIYGHIFIMDSNVSAVGKMLDGDRLLYFKDISGNICDLYMLDDTKTDSVGHRIGENVSLLDDYFKVVNNGKTLLFCERFNNETKSGNLFMYTNQNRQLATDVNSIYYRNDTLVYFLRNLHGGKADLYSFGANGLILVDTDVSSVRGED